jgi:hypothetical protein
MPLIGAQGPGSNISWRGNLDEYPDSFSFVEVTEVFPGAAATCSPETITGINYKALVTATGAGASVRVTPYIEETDSYGPVGPFLPGDDVDNNPVIIRNKDKIEIQVVTEAPGVLGRDAFNKTYPVNVTIGKRGPEGWFAKTRLLDDDPIPFDFVDLNNLEINTLTNSDVVTVDDIDNTIGVDIFIVGTGQLQVNGNGVWTQTAKIFDGQTLQLRNTTSNFYSTQVETVVQIGIFQANWIIQSRAADTTINDFTFNDIVDVDINTIHESNSITISGADENLNGNNPLPLTFSGNGQYKITRGGTTVQDFTDTSPSSCNNGDVITLKQTASGNYLAKTDATLTVSNRSDTYSVTTRPRPIDTIPNQFTFTDQNNVLRNELIYSNTITLAGMTAFGDEGTASIGGNGSPQYQVTRNGSVVRSWTNNSFGVQLGDQIQLRLLSATASQGTRSATFTIAGTNTFNVISGVNGSTSDTWNVTSKARDCGVTSFSLPNIPEASSTLNPGQQASTEFTVNGSFEFDCNISATTSNANSFLKKKGTNQQGTTLSNLVAGDVVEVYMTTPYYCSTRTTTVSLSAAFTTPGSTKSTTWTISPKAPPKPSLTLSADNLNPPFVFPDGGSTTIRYSYTHVTNSSVTATGPGGFSNLSSIPVTTLGDQTKSGSRNVSDLVSGQSTFTLTVSNCTGTTTESINVITGTPPNPTLFFCVNTNPPTSSCPTTFNISRGNSATLYWSSTNAIKVEATAGTGFNTNDKQSGNDTVTPASDGEVYTAKATGAGVNPAVVSKSITFRFKPSVSLSASPANVITGNNVTVTWSSADADRVTSSSGPSFNSISALSGSTTINMGNDGNYTWSITVKDDGTGESATASDTVSVKDDTTVDNYNMDPSSETNRNLGERRESQPRFTSSPTNSVHGLSPGVSVTAKVSGGGATFLNGSTTKTVSNGTSCNDLRIKMNASNSYSTTKTATMNIGGVSKTFSVKTKSCIVENGTYGLAGCTLQTRRFISSNGYNLMGLIGISNCNGTTGGSRENTTSGTVDRFSNQKNSTFTLPQGTARIEAKGVAGGGGAGCDRNSGEEGAGGGGGGGSFNVEWNQAEGGDVVTFWAGRGGDGKSGDDGNGSPGESSFIEIRGARQNSRASSGGGGGGGTNSAGGGGGGSGSGSPGRSGGGRRGDEGGHGGGAARINGGQCNSGQADRGSRPCDQGGPGQGTDAGGGCGGSNRQEKGTEEGASGNTYGGGGSGGGCGNGGGRGADGLCVIRYYIEFQRETKVNVMKRINKAYWDDLNRPASGGEVQTWYNRFKDDPAGYPTLDSMYNTIRSSISGSRATNPRDNCGNSYPKLT